MRAGLFAILLAVVCGCSTLATFTADKFGQARRATLVRRLNQSCKAQQQLQANLRSTLEQFESLVEFEGGNRQKQANRMSAELARCETRAKDVRARNAEVDRAAENLFREWKAASEKHPEEMYQRDRGAKRRNAHRDFNRMRAVMRAAESKSESTMAIFRNQVETALSVFFDPSFSLGDNLNARAQASLQAESQMLAAQMDFLIQDLSDSIVEAQLYIQNLAD
jgi:hypothetical protein